MILSSIHIRCVPWGVTKVFNTPQGTQQMLIDDKIIFDRKC